MRENDELGDPDATEQALRWLVRLTSGASTPNDHNDFRAWRDTDSKNAAALARARAIWQLLGVTRAEADAPASSDNTNLSGERGNGARHASIWQYDFVTGWGESVEQALSDDHLLPLSQESDTSVTGLVGFPVGLLKTNDYFGTDMMRRLHV